MHRHAGASFNRVSVPKNDQGDAGAKLSRRDALDGCAWIEPSRTTERSARHLDLEPEVRRDLCGGGRRGADPQRIFAVSDALEQEEAVEVGAGGRETFPRAVDQLEVDALRTRVRRS